jgi:anti-anti-sigma factor
MSDAAAVRASVRRVGDSAVIDIVGEIDGAADKVLARAYQEAAIGPPARLLLNFSGVDYINSTGLAVIVAVLARSRKDNIPLISYGLTDHYQEVFRITRLSDFMQVLKDEDSALRSGTFGEQ